MVEVSFAEGVSESNLDASADEATVGLDDTERKRIEDSVAVINAVYGNPDRLKKFASDPVEYWENRSKAMTSFLSTDERPSTPGKATIAGATREICANLYSHIVALRPD